MTRNSSGRQELRLPSHCKKTNVVAVGSCDDLPPGLYASHQISNTVEGGLTDLRRSIEGCLQNQPDLLGFQGGGQLKQPVPMLGTVAAGLAAETILGNAAAPEAGELVAQPKNDGGSERESAVVDLRRDDLV